MLNLGCSLLFCFENRFIPCFTLAQSSFDVFFSVSSCYSQVVFCCSLLFPYCCCTEQTAKGSAIAAAKRTVVIFIFCWLLSRILIGTAKRSLISMWFILGFRRTNLSSIIINKNHYQINIFSKIICSVLEHPLYYTAQYSKILFG